MAGSASVKISKAPRKMQIRFSSIARKRCRSSKHPIGASDQLALRFVGPITKMEPYRVKKTLAVGNAHESIECDAKYYAGIGTQQEEDEMLRYFKIVELDWTADRDLARELTAA